MGKAFRELLNEYLESDMADAPKHHSLLTRDCPSLTRLNKIVTEPGSINGPETEHIAGGCRYCKKTIAMIQRELGVASFDVTRSATYSGPRKLSEYIHAIMRSVVPQQLSVERYASEVTSSQSRFVFDDGKTRAALTPRSDGSYRLTIECPVLPEGSLLAINLGSSEAEELMWRRFVVLYPGWESPEAVAIVEYAFKVATPIAVVEVETSELTAADADLLVMSFRAAQNNDPMAVPYWQKWAEQILPLAEQGRVREVVEEISKATS